MATVDSSTITLDQFKHRGLTGLTNIGNTCFMNTAVQCLSHSIPLTWYFIRNVDSNPSLSPKTYHPEEGQKPPYFEDLSNSSREIIEETSVLHEWYRLIRGIWKKNGVVEPKSFHFSVQHLAIKKNNTQFGGGAQNDVHEFLVFLIDNMHLAMEREVNISISGTPKTQLDHLALQAAKSWKSFFKDKYSVFVDLFYGQYISYVESVSDSELTPEQSFSYDPFCIMSVEMPTLDRPITLVDCLQHFTKEEILDGDCKWYSERDKCHKKAKKKVMFWKTPNLLIIHLKRFNPIGLQKRNDLVDIPHTLNLEPFCIGYDKFNSKYRLYGIANHTGNRMFGHYYAYCKNPNGQWSNFNDSSVTPIKQEDIITNNAYCLFYQKIKE